MKRILLTLLILTISLYGRWRDGEQEILVNNVDESFMEIFNKHKLNGEFGGDGVRLYLTEDEREVLDSYGISYTITIDDLNTHYQGFWKQDIPSGYYSFEKVQSLSDSLADNFPDICKKYIYGTSVNGRELGALKISANPDIDEIEPEIMFDGGFHGDEIGATEYCIRFARDLVQKYGVDDEITELINSREIWIYYCVNPDGRVDMSRYNANGVDLNRDWGYMWDGWGDSPSAFSQDESKALRSCIYDKSFVIHTSYHSGVEYIIYPWCYSEDICPDYSFNDDIATLYSINSGYQGLPQGSCNSGLYPVNGASNDTNYGVFGAVSLTMELSVDKQPPSAQLAEFYNKNYPSMVKMIEYSGYGISGQVVDSETGDPVTAAIFINNSFPCYTDINKGDFHKYISPGSYNITVKANGYESKTVENIVVTAGSSTFNEISLVPIEGSQYIHKVCSSQIPGNNSEDPADTPAVIGEIDQRYYSLGKDGWIVFDMLTPIEDSAGPDIMIYEGDQIPEGYTLYGSETMDGEWKFLGTGNGSSQFDLSVGNLGEARYFKIVDDGDGFQNSFAAGFDFDGAKGLESIPGPYLALIDFSVLDSNGNSDGVVDPGEEGLITYTIKNNGDQSAESIELFLEPAEYIILDENQFTIPDIEVGGEYSGEFFFMAALETPNGYNGSVNLNFSVDPDFSFQFSIPFRVGGYILEEYFDSFPGDGWSVVGENWQGSGTNLAGGDAPEAKFKWSPAIVADQYLISPTINTLPIDSLKIYFNHALDDYSGIDYEISLVATVDGENWETIKSFETTTFNGKVDSAIVSTISNLSSDQFKFAFLFSGDSYKVNSWSIDNVLVSKYKSSDLEESLPSKPELSQNYPNPFNPTTTINFSLPSRMELDLTIFNSKGEVVEKLSKGVVESGYHSVQFDGSSLSSGIYYYRLSSDQFTISRKMALIK